MSKSANHFPFSVLIGERAYSILYSELRPTKLLIMKYFSLILSFVFASILSLSAQDGNIRVSGRVTDGSTGDVLIGATIIVKGTSIGAVSALDGDYSIMVPESGATLVYSFIGYTSQEFVVGDKRVIDVTLSIDATDLEEVVVTTQAKGQIGARSRQINSNTLVNVVAPDRLQENPDANAVEAIGRLPGISVMRNGGEGTGLVIRGLEPKYNAVTLNGIELPSTSGTTRGTNLSGISQYVLQGVEVYKSLTSNMEANSVGGTINLTLKETPKGLHTTLMAQLGYNALNSYFGNYKFLGEVSNRFFNDKLGVFLSLNAERVNRSVESMSAGYDYVDNTPQLHVGNANLNKITRLNERRSATLSLDYRLHRTTKLKLYGLYSYSGGLHESQSKAYTPDGAGSVGYNMSYNPYNTTQMMQTALSGETKLDFLNLAMDYGVAYSFSIGDDPDSRSWNWRFLKASDATITTQEITGSYYPSEIIPLFYDSPDSLQNLELVSMGKSFSELRDDNLTAYLDLEIPFKAGDFLNGSFKFGGKYRQKKRFRDVTNGSQTVVTNQYLTEFADQDLDWVQLSSDAEEITGVNFEDYMVGTVLNGDYDFGWYFSNDRLNEFTDWWSDLSDYWWNQGPEAWRNQFGEVTKIGWQQNIEGSVMGDQDITEHYYAGYGMFELNLGKYLMLLPGVRYEQTQAEMQGWEVFQPVQAPNVKQPMPGQDTTATRETSFLLPMLHARVKPTDFLYFHFAYTQTLSRPQFDAISPNTFYNSGFSYTYKSGNPQLAPEFWTNFDLQATLHNPKIGLLSIGGFYKTVEDKIWNRQYKRIKGDPLIEGFPDNANVTVTAWENHEYTVFVKGIEAEWQTSFWYLPKPFSFFTLYLNYTYTQTETQYPNTRIENVVPPEGGRPTPVRIDSTVVGPMLNQPEHIANVNLGFNYKNFNTWLGFQYNGNILTSKDYYDDSKDDIKDNFYRFDLQLTYEIPLKSKGDLQILLNIANISNYLEVKHKRYELRPMYEEAYGWTVDLGVRYSL